MNEYRLRSTISNSFQYMMMVLMGTIISHQSSSNASELDLENNLSVVLTPTRLRQSLADVPGSVTIITADMIHRLGIRSVPDVLRLVPGMAVTQITGTDYRINYHGTNILFPRRLNVLIDGVAIYGLRVSRVDWDVLPVALENIDRIEVTRGSNSASYGSNSMMAVINIITKHPGEMEGITFHTIGGSLNTLGGMVRYGGRIGNSTAYNVTVEHQENHGFDYASSFGKGHDTSRIDKLSLRSVTDLTDSETLDVRLSLVQGMNEAEFVDSSQRSFPDVYLHDYSVDLTWKRNISHNHALQTQVYAMKQARQQAWRSCLPAAYLLPEVFDLGRISTKFANDVLSGKVPSDGTMQTDLAVAAARNAIRVLGTKAKEIICVDANQDFVEQRYDIEFQDTIIFSNALRAVSGLGVRYEYVNSDTYFGDKVRNRIWRAFSNFEYKPYSSMNINVGGFLEKDDLTGYAFSPRIALNTRATDNSTFRFIISKAARMPDALEQRADWTYKTTNYSSPLNNATEGHFYRSAISPGNLTSEKIFSKEIGYLGNFPQYGVVFDAKLFEDNLTDLISEKLQNSSFVPTNRNFATLRGAEMQLNYAPTKKWMIYLAYSYLKNNASIVFERSQYAKNSGALAITYLLESGWLASFAYYGYGANTLEQSSYGRNDLLLSKSYRLAKDIRLTPTFVASYLNNRTSSFLVDIGQRRESRFNDAMQYYVSLKLEY